MVEVSEGDGFVELCARVVNGTLSRNVLINVVYEDRNAMGKMVWEHT